MIPLVLALVALLVVWALLVWRLDRPDPAQDDSHLADFGGE